MVCKKCSRLTAKLVCYLMSLDFNHVKIKGVAAYFKLIAIV